MVEEWQGLRMEKSDTGESSGEHRKARSPEQGHPASERRGTAVYGSGRRRCTQRLMLRFGETEVYTEVHTEMHTETNAEESRCEDDEKQQP